MNQSEIQCRWNEQSPAELGRNLQSLWTSGLTSLCLSFFLWEKGGQTPPHWQGAWGSWGQSVLWARHMDVRMKPKVVSQRAVLPRSRRPFPYKQRHRRLVA